MIIDNLVSALKNIILWFIELFPVITIDSSYLSSNTFSVFSDSKLMMNYFLGSTIANVLLANFVLWIVAFPSASLIKWLYKKIPTVS